MITAYAHQFIAFQITEQMIPLSHFPFDARPDALASGRAGGAGSPRNICNPVVIICLIICRHYILSISIFLREYFHPFCGLPVRFTNSQSALRY